MSSQHLEALIAQNHGSAHMQVVHINIVQYSKRQSYSQSAVIHEFTRLVNSALLDLAQQAALSAEDIVKAPTGDGIIIAFTFDDDPALANQFVKSFDEGIRQLNQRIHCQHFENTQWCNCHPHFHAKMTINGGRGIVYKDANGSYNVVGPRLARIAVAAGASEAMVTSLPASLPPILHIEL